MSSLSAKLRFLIAFVKIPQEMWDIIFPHGPVLGKAVREYLMAGIVRDISQEITNEKVAERLKPIGKTMAEFAAANLVAGWEDGDDLCPRLPHFPFPFPYPQPTPGPDPLPWLQFNQVDLNPQPLPPKALAAALKVISQATVVTDAAGQLQELSRQLGRGQF